MKRIRLGAWLSVFGLPAVLLLSVVLPATSASAQSATVQLSPSPYYQSEPIDVHLIVEGFDESPTPEVSFAPPQRGQLDFLGVDPSVRSSVQFINGRVTSSKQVEFVYRYRFMPSGTGAAQVGPFTITQGTERAQTQPVRLAVQAIGENDRVQIAISWPDTPVYPGQRMNVDLKWTFDAELHDRMQRYDIDVPIFDRTDLFRFIDPQAQTGQTQLTIQTRNGPINLKADIEDTVVDGRRVKVVTARRILIPLQPGEFEFPGASVMIQEVTRYRRDLFGQRTPQAVRKVPAADRPRKLVVRDVPREGRPESYAGAIGLGFSFEVSANRSVVQVGDPIELELTLRGDGNLESASLPDLSRSGGLAPDLFRVPTGGVTGILEDGAKTFHLQVRVLDASVREVPPLEYSYFDTEKNAYRTVTSQPIALSVRRAQMVTADDVVSTVPESRANAPALPSASEAPGSVPLGDSRSATGQLVLTGANLSIVREPSSLLRSGSGGRGLGGALAALYGVPLMALAGAFWVRRRADLDPALVARRKLFRDETQRIQSAAGHPQAEAMASCADALRAMLRAAPEARPPDLDAFLAECDAIAYAPRSGAGGSAIDPEKHARALALARAIEEGAR